MIQKKKKQYCKCEVETQGLKCPICGLFKSIGSVTDKTTANDHELEAFFQKHISIISDNKLCCQECGIPIHNPTKWNVAHILPKAIFFSVRTSDDNILYLCRTNGCHSRFDSNWSTAQKMKVWPIALGKVGRFIHLVKERHKIVHIFSKIKP